MSDDTVTITALAERLAAAERTLDVYRASPAYRQADFDSRQRAAAAAVPAAAEAALRGDHAPLLALDAHGRAAVARGGRAIEIMERADLPAALRAEMLPLCSASTRVEIEVRRRVAAGDVPRHEVVRPARGCSLNPCSRATDEASVKRMIDAGLSRFCGIDAHRRAHAVTGLGWSFDDGTSWTLPMGSAKLLAEIDRPFAGELRAGRVRVEPATHEEDLAALRAEVAADGARHAPARVGGFVDYTGNTDF